MDHHFTTGLPQGTPLSKSATLEAYDSPRIGYNGFPGFVRDPRRTPITYSLPSPSASPSCSHYNSLSTSNSVLPPSLDSLSSGSLLSASTQASGLMTPQTRTAQVGRSGLPDESWFAALQEQYLASPLSAPIGSITGRGRLNKSPRAGTARPVELETSTSLSMDSGFDKLPVSGTVSPLPPPTAAELELERFFTGTPQPSGPAASSPLTMESQHKRRVACISSTSGSWTANASVPLQTRGLYLGTPQAQTLALHPPTPQSHPRRLEALPTPLEANSKDDRWIPLQASKDTTVADLSIGVSASSPLSVAGSSQVSPNWPLTSFAGSRRTASGLTISIPATAEAAGTYITAPAEVERMLAHLHRETSGNAKAMMRTPGGATAAPITPSDPLIGRRGLLPMNNPAPHQPSNGPLARSKRNSQADLGVVSNAELRRGSFSRDGAWPRWTSGAAKKSQPAPPVLSAQSATTQGHFLPEEPHTDADSHHLEAQPEGRQADQRISGDYEDFPWEQDLLGRVGRSVSTSGVGGSCHEFQSSAVCLDYHQQYPQLPTQIQSSMLFGNNPGPPPPTLQQSTVAEHPQQSIPLHFSTVAPPYPAPHIDGSQEYRGVVLDPDDLHLLSGTGSLPMESRQTILEPYCNIPTWMSQPATPTPMAQDLRFGDLTGSVGVLSTSQIHQQPDRTVTEANRTPAYGSIPLAPIMEYTPSAPALNNHQGTPSTGHAYCPEPPPPCQPMVDQSPISLVNTSYRISDQPSQSLSAPVGPLANIFVPPLSPRRRTSPQLPTSTAPDPYNPLSFPAIQKSPLPSLLFNYTVSDQSIRSALTPSISLHPEPPATPTTARRTVSLPNGPCVTPSRSVYTTPAPSPSRQLAGIGPRSEAKAMGMGDLAAQRRRATAGPSTPTQPPKPVHGGFRRTASSPSRLHSAATAATSKSGGKVSKGPGSSLFVNFTSRDAVKLLTGVAPSGSSKRKREGEEEAGDRKEGSRDAKRRVMSD